MFIYNILLLLYSLLPYTTCFLYNSFVHASNLPKLANYTFYCSNNTEGQKFFTIYLDYFSNNKNSMYYLRFIPYLSNTCLTTDKIIYQNNKCQIINFEHSEENLNLLFNPLTIDPSDTNADIKFVKLFSTYSIDELQFTQYWYTHLSITLLSKVELQVKFNKDPNFYANQQERNNLPKSLNCDLMLLQYTHFNQRKNKNHFNFGYLNNFINIHDMDEIANIHNYLYELGELNSADQITTIILDNTKYQPLKHLFLKKLRKIFCNLSTISWLNEKALNYSDLLHYSTGSLILKSILYDQEKNYSPLTFHVNNCEQTRKNIQKNVLLWYKYAHLYPLFFIYFLLHLYIICYEGLHNQCSSTLGVSSFIVPYIHFIAGSINRHNISFSPNKKKSYDFFCFEINANSCINRSDYFFVISMLLHLGYLMELKKHTPLKTLLIHRICTIGFLKFVHVLNGFEPERLVFHMLSNKNIFTQS